MSEFLQGLAKAALVGTARQAPTLPELAGAIGELMRELGQQEGPEQTVLRAAGVAALCAAAGYEPGRIETGHGSAAAETVPVLRQPAGVSALGDILRSGPERLQRLACARVGKSGLVLAPALLPAALDLGCRQSSLRAALRPLLGKRGDWLAAQNTDWRWALALPEDAAAFAWDEAAQEQRLAWLSLNLARQPELARQYLQNGFGALAARERLSLLECFAAHITLADEAFVEGLLKDRSKDVRILAARLLSALSGSAFAQRQGGRMAGFLGKRRKLLREVLEFNPPEAFDAEWKKDTIEEDKPQYEELGQRAWWALQLIQLTPLSWWTDYSGLSPAELLAWAGGTDWKQALLRGWLQALDAQHDPAWAEAWLEFRAPKGLRVDSSRLLMMLAEEKRERYWLQVLRQYRGSEHFSQQLGPLLATLPGGSLIENIDMAELILKELQGHGAQRDYQLMYILPELACVLPDALLPAARNGALHEALARVCSQDSVARFITIIEQRLTLHSALQDETP